MEISWSKLRKWKRCRRAYYYRYVERLQPRVKALPLFRGSMIGECLDQVAEKKSPERVLEKYQAVYQKLLPAEKEYYGPVVSDVQTIIERYRKKYQKDGLKYLRLQNRTSEFEVQVDLGDGISFYGKIDKIVSDQSSRVLVMDHKSHKKIPDEKARFTDLQLVFYVWACEHSGLPKPDGVIWDYIRTKPPTVPELLKNGTLTTRKDLDTDYDTYRTAIREHGLDPADYAEILDRLKTQPDRFFQRVTLPSAPKAMVKEVVRDLKETAIEIKFLGETSKSRNMSIMTCGGCEFFAICQAELRGHDTDHLRKTDFQVRESQREHNEEIEES